MTYHNGILTNVYILQRRFSRRGRQKLLNVSTDQSNGADNSVVIENGGVVPVACVSLSTENQVCVMSIIIPHRNTTCLCHMTFLSFTEEAIY